jgi:hypothetical protein
MQGCAKARHQIGPPRHFPSAAVLDRRQQMNPRLAKAKSRRSTMSFDRRTGRWTAKLGKKRTPGGTVEGHKFRFSMNKR